MVDKTVSENNTRSMRGFDSINLHRGIEENVLQKHGFGAEITKFSEANSDDQIDVTESEPRRPKTNHLNFTLLLVQAARTGTPSSSAQARIGWDTCPALLYPLTHKALLATGTKIEWVQ